jgi:hypothetical protein
MLTVDAALEDLQRAAREVAMGRPNLSERMPLMLAALSPITPARGRPLLRALRHTACELDRNDSARRTFIHAARALLTLSMLP